MTRTETKSLWGSWSCARIAFIKQNVHLPNGLVEMGMGFVRAEKGKKMRLIDADLLKLNDFEILLGGSYKGLLQILLEKIEDAPTVDAEPVVRCKDCKMTERKYKWYCVKRQNIVNDDDFCSWGERKEDADK